MLKSLSQLIDSMVGLHCNAIIVLCKITCATRDQCIGV